MQLAVTLFLAVLFLGAVDRGVSGAEAPAPITLHYADPEAEKGAAHLATVFPRLCRELEETLGLAFTPRPNVWLETDPQRFQRLAGNAAIGAFAEPARQLVVMDYRQLQRFPLKSELVFKHELCHLLLHAHIPFQVLPLWFEEGVCQWVSQDVHEYFGLEKRSRLNRVALTGRWLPLQYLAAAFPHEQDAMFLAYEESLSFMEYLLARHGIDGLHRLLLRLKTGDTIQAAFRAALGEHLTDMEGAWQKTLHARLSWFAYLSAYLYEIIFAALGGLTIWAYLQMRRRRKAQADAMAAEEIPPGPWP